MMCAIYARKTSPDHRDADLPIRESPDFDPAAARPLESDPKVVRDWLMFAQAVSDLVLPLSLTLADVLKERKRQSSI
jgi:hypothetical protein